MQQRVGKPLLCETLKRVHDGVNSENATPDGQLENMR